MRLPAAFRSPSFVPFGTVLRPIPGPPRTSGRAGAAFFILYRTWGLWWLGDSRWAHTPGRWFGGVWAACGRRPFGAATPWEVPADSQSTGLWFHPLLVPFSGSANPLWASRDHLGAGELAESPTPSPCLTFPSPASLTSVNLYTANRQCHSQDEDPNQPHRPPQSQPTTGYLIA